MFENDHYQPLVCSSVAAPVTGTKKMSGPGSSLISKQE